MSDRNIPSKDESPLDHLRAAVLALVNWPDDASVLRPGTQWIAFEARRGLTAGDLRTLMSVVQQVEAADAVIADLREILAEFNSEDVRVMARRAMERIRELGSRDETKAPLAEQFHDMLHRDQTGLAAGLHAVLGVVGGFQWARESRGSYEWDDDRFYAEMGNMLDAVKKAADEALDRWKRGPLPCCVAERSAVKAAEKEESCIHDVPLSKGCMLCGHSLPRIRAEKTSVPTGENNG